MPSNSTVPVITLKALSKRKAKERRETAALIKSGNATRREIQLRNAPYSTSKVKVSKLFNA